MAFFKSSKSHLEVIETECQAIAEGAAAICDRCDRSLRGKFQNMMPEDRAALLKEAGALVKKLHASYATVQEQQQLMDQEQSTNEDRLAAQARLVAARIDVDRTTKSVDEARHSLVVGMAEIEQFYGPRSPEARHIRKVLDDLAAG